LFSQEALFRIHRSSLYGEDRKIESDPRQISQNVIRCESENKFLQKDDFMWDSISVDAIKNIDEREKKMKEEISKYAQELKDNIEKNKSKNKHMIAEMATEIDKTRNTLEDQQETIQSAIESIKAAIIFAVAAEHGDWMSNLSFTKLRPEMQEFVSREQHISKSFGILTSVKLSKKSHDADLKALKSYTTDLPGVTRLASLDTKKAWISSSAKHILRHVVIDDQIITIKEIPVKIYDMAPTRSNDILISIIKSSDVKLITQ
jgi:hypothetical protein